jgi:hypothetical protein
VRRSRAKGIPGKRRRRSRGVEEPRSRAWSQGTERRNPQVRGVKERWPALYLHYFIPSNNMQAEPRAGCFIHPHALWLLDPLFGSSAPRFLQSFNWFLHSSTPPLLGSSAPWLLHSSAPQLLRLLRLLRLLFPASPLQLTWLLLTLLSCLQ